MKETSIRDDHSFQFGAAWLVRLRWIALVGQFFLCLFAGFWLKLVLPWGLFLACMGVVWGTNAIVAIRMRQGYRTSRAVVAALVFGDIGVLTLMLYFAGGAHNPFTLFYILHIALIAILLPSRVVPVAIAACGLGFWLLFTSPYPLVSAEGVSCCNDMTMHLQGMALAMILTGAAVSYFVTRLHHSLAEAERLLQISRKAHEEKQRFNSLATLAAGVAHELATPLGTIAVIGRDLEAVPDEALSGEEVRGDLRLIRREVDRCRGVIERLGERARLREREDGEPLRLELLPTLLGAHLPEGLAQRVVWRFGRLAVPVWTVPLTEWLQSLAVLVKNGCEASAPHQLVSISVVSTPERVTFTVRDEGSGMDVETLERLGEPFFTRKAGGGGMGLGIFLARVFCEERGGSLSFRSRPGEGTQAICQFPVHMESEGKTP